MGSRKSSSPGFTKPPAYYWQFRIFWVLSDLCTTARPNDEWLILLWPSVFFKPPPHVTPRYDTVFTFSSYLTSSPLLSSLPLPPAEDKQYICKIRDLSCKTCGTQCCFQVSWSILPVFRESIFCLIVSPPLFLSFFFFCSHFLPHKVGHFFNNNLSFHSHTPLLKTIIYGLFNYYDEAIIVFKVHYFSSFHCLWPLSFSSRCQIEAQNILNTMV